jgi:alpha-beta hydrolase superfamily lysophospholipase
VEKLSFEDADGIEVGYRRWLPTATRGIVLVLHGASEHGGRYDRFANALVDDGWAVYAIDHRGHGLTSTSTGRGIMGPRGADGLLDDIDQLRALAVVEQGDVPLVVFGHSMGSLIALAYVERAGAGLVGCVLSGSPGMSDGVAEMAAMVRQMADSGMADATIEALSPFNASFEPARTPYDWLSRDEAEVDAYIADPDCGDELPFTYGFLAEIMSVTSEATERDAIASVPVGMKLLLVSGERDAASNDAAAARLLEQALRETGHDVVARYYPDARHELLNEINRDEVTDDIIGWLRELRSGHAE